MKSSVFFVADEAVSTRWAGVSSEALVLSISISPLVHAVKISHFFNYTEMSLGWFKLCQLTTCSCVMKNISISDKVTSLLVGRSVHQGKLILVLRGTLLRTCLLCTIIISSSIIKVVVCMNPKILLRDCHVGEALRRCLPATSGRDISSPHSSPHSNTEALQDTE